MRSHAGHWLHYWLHCQVWTTEAANGGALYMAKRRRPGEGSVYQRASDGRWVATLELERPGGGRRRRTVTASTHKEVMAKLRTLKREAEHGVLPDKTTVEQWLNHWLDNIAAHKLKASTLDGYRRYIDRELIPVLGKVQLARLTGDHVRSLHQTMRNRGASTTTTRQAHSILQASLSRAVKDQRVMRNVALLADTPPADTNPHPILTADQSRRVLTGAADERELCRLVCALILGLRQGEALGLTWDDVLLSGEIGTLTIRQTVARIRGQGLVVGTPKTKSSRRQVPLIPHATAAFAAWREVSGGHGFVFHGHAGPDAPESPERDHRAWKAALARAGVPPIPLHGARGSAATLLQQLGVPERVIADIVGHKHVRVLQEHYLRSDEAQRRAALESLGAALQLTSGTPAPAVDPAAPFSAD